MVKIVKVHGRSGTLKIAPHGQILIRHKAIIPQELQVGNEILAYGFDIVPYQVV